ncbi:type II toxin-antitoxin system VapC family toxin [Persicitalea sp.]|uniref:type II toxin-antitoxin system VapC family toxin n=1 Tax=Persicitalea sp. TaxID=3100273 RepID=UPI0035940B7A
MHYLIDTQILLWFQSNDPELDQSTRAILIDGKNQIYVSYASLYEIVIKLKIGKLPNFHVSVESVVEVAIQDKIKFLPITISHLVSYDKIPLYAEHRDPFDRLILAVALSNSLPIITSDAKFGFYRSLVEVIEV